MPRPTLTHSQLTADKAKRATLADNALKLEGKSAAQVAALAPQAPPVTSVAGLSSLKSAAWSLTGGHGTTFTVACDAGKKATGGGFNNPVGDVLPFEDGPTPDGAGWFVFLGNLSNTAAASGNVYVICLA